MTLTPMTLTPMVTSRRVDGTLRPSMLPSSSGASLLFSVIVPTRDRPRQLRACLDSLARLAFPQDEHEIIVVDDGGAQGAAVTTLPASRGVRLRTLRQDSQGPAAARNLGASQARGRWLAFIDDDCRADPGWLAALAPRLAAAPANLVGGQVINGLPDNLFSVTNQLIETYVQGKRPDGRVQPEFLVSMNMAMLASRFRSLNGFDSARFSHHAEDRDFCARWQSAGGGLSYAEDALVLHFHDHTLSSFLKGHYRAGTGAYRFHELRSTLLPEQIGWHHWSYYLDLIRRPLKERSGATAARLVLLSTLSQLAVAAGYAREGIDSWRRR